jgi:hypothetical protein
MASLKAIKGKVAEIRVCTDPSIPERERTDADYFTLWYKPHAMTVEAENKMLKAAEGGRDVAGLVELAYAVWSGWDIKFEESDTEPAPLDHETLEELGGDVIRAVFDQIREARFPNPNGTGQQSRRR